MSISIRESNWVSQIMPAIQSIEIFSVTVAFKVPYKLSRLYGTLSTTTAIVVRLETKSGLVGWGEANPQPPFTEETPGGVMAALSDYLGPALIGLDGTNPNAAMADMEATLSGNLSAKAAVDMALHDITGKAAGLPVHALLGGALRQSIDVLWPLGSGTHEEDFIVIDAKIAEGYRTFMAKMGAQPVDVEIERMRVLTERYHPQVSFICDANQGWSESEALRFIQGVNSLPLALIEQPVAKHNFEAMKRLRQSSTAPISADESLQSLDQAARLVHEQAADAFSLKVSKNGGIAAAQKMAVLAEAEGMTCLMNSMLELGITQAASLQLGCTLPNLMDVGHAYMSTLRLADDITDFSNLVSQGVARVPDGPGLGIAVDEEKLRRLADEHRHLEVSEGGLSMAGAMT